MEDPRERLKDLSGIELQTAIKKIRREQIIKLICRQTDYTSEAADEKLIFWKGNYLHVIREWMNPNFTPEKKEKKYVSKNQGILGEIRNFMDEGVRQRKIVEAQIAYKKRIMELQKKKAEEQKKTQEAAMAEGNKKIEQ
jgi:hypothetical protein